MAFAAVAALVTVALAFWIAPPRAAVLPGRLVAAAPATAALVPPEPSLTGPLPAEPRPAEPSVERGSAGSAPVARPTPAPDPLAFVAANRCDPHVLGPDPWQPLEVGGDPWWRGPAPLSPLIWMLDSGEAIARERRMPGAFGPAEAIAWAVAALAAGPDPAESATGAFSEVPSGTRVLSVARAPGRWLVRVSPDVAAGGGSAAMIGRVHQLRRTLTGLPGVDAVQLLVAGCPLVVWGGEGLMTPPVWVSAGTRSDP